MEACGSLEIWGRKGRWGVGIGVQCWVVVLMVAVYGGE